MKLPRNARIFQGQLDIAPFAGVFFLLLMFILFQSSLVHTPGVRIDLPDVPNSLPGPSTPALVLAIDASGRIYFEGQSISEDQLLDRLRAAVKNSKPPLSLIIEADKNGRLETLVRITNVARSAGVADVFWGTKWWQENRPGSP